MTPYAALYYLLLWVVPIFTSFSFFMILRQLVQHGNGDRGWLTNTRVFFVNPLINFAVFPLGQDYHLPHHLFASVPHYRLKALHERLLQCAGIPGAGGRGGGIFLPYEKPPTKPTVLDVLGPPYHHRAEEVYIDNAVLMGMRWRRKRRFCGKANRRKKNAGPRRGDDGNLGRGSGELHNAVARLRAFAAAAVLARLRPVAWAALAN